jgi:hypothetical protein
MGLLKSKLARLVPNLEWASKYLDLLKQANELSAIPRALLSEDNIYQLKQALIKKELILLAASNAALNTELFKRSYEAGKLLQGTKDKFKEHFKFLQVKSLTKMDDSYHYWNNNKRSSTPRTDEQSEQSAISSVFRGKYVKQKTQEEDSSIDDSSRSASASASASSSKSKNKKGNTRNVTQRRKKEKAEEENLAKSTKLTIPGKKIKKLQYSASPSPSSSPSSRNKDLENWHKSSKIAYGSSYSNYKTLEKKLMEMSNDNLDLAKDSLDRLDGIVSRSSKHDESKEGDRKFDSN